MFRPGSFLAKVVMAAILPASVVMDQDHLKDALFVSSGDRLERFYRTISRWRVGSVVDQVQDKKLLPSHPIASSRSRFELA